MGFDNECVLNIQSLPGEYFCPVCRLLVYPNEALQSQCTHLYCKPCLTYIVNTTQACPYDGYLVTQADSKPLVESNKALADTIGKITVHCLFHRSGCTWQGPLSECTSHCSGCAFGNSPVVCNRCSLQIVHHQVQEHAQNCPGVQPQASQIQSVHVAAAAGAAVTVDQTQVAAQAVATTSQVQTQTAATAPHGKDHNQQSSFTSQPQSLVQAAVPTAEQWYQQQQQYQQYYLQYHGYNPYQQHYQQYYPYQQQPHLQVQPQVQPQAQSQPLMQQQVQSQPQMQPLAQVQPVAHSQPQLQPSHPPIQAVASQHHNQPQVNQQKQTHPLHHGQPLPQTQSYPQAQSQSYPQAQSQFYPQAQPPQPHPIQPNSLHMQMPQYQQPHNQIQHIQPQIQHLVPQPQPQPQSQSNPQTLQTQVQHLPQPQSQPQLRPSFLNQPQVQHTTANAVMGHNPYPQTQPQPQLPPPPPPPPQPHLQIPLSAPQQHPMYVHSHTGAQPQLQNHFPQPAPLMRPPQSHATILNQPPSTLSPTLGKVANIPPAQQLPVRPHAPQPGVPVSQNPVMQTVQQPMTQQYAQHTQPFAGRHQQCPFVQQQLPVHPQSHPEDPHNVFQRHPHTYSQAQLNVLQMHGMQPHQPHSLGQPLTPNHGVRAESSQQSATSLQGTPAQPGTNQSSSNQSNLAWANNQVQLSSEKGAGVKPEMSAKIAYEREAESPFEKTAKTDNLDAPRGVQASVIGMKTAKSETDAKVMVNKIKPEVEDKTNVVDTSSKEFKRDFGSQTVENATSLNKNMVKEEIIENVGDQRDLANVDIKQEEHSVSKEVQDEALLKTPQIDQVAKFGKQSGAVQKEQKLPLAQGTQGPGPVPQSDMVQAGGFVPSPPSLYGSSTLQQRPTAPLIFQAPPGAIHQTEAITQFREPMLKPHRAEIPPGGIPVSGPAGSFRRGGGPHGPYKQGSEPPSVAPQGPYNLGHSHPSHFGTARISHRDLVGGPLLRSGLPSAFDSHGGVMEGGPVYGHEGQMGQKQPSNPMEAEMFASQRPGYMDSRRPESHFLGSLQWGPHGPTSGIRSNMMRMNGALGPDLQDERFKSFADELLDPSPMHPARRVIDRGEFEDLKQFPRPSHLEAETVPKVESHFLSSRPFDKGPMGGFAPSRFLPPYHDDAAGRSESSHTHPDFSGQGPAFGQRHVGGLSPRSPFREFRGFGGLAGSLGDREFRRFGPPIGNSIHENRFPVLPGHMRRDEVEGPGWGGDYIGQDFLPSHLRRGEPLDPHNLRLGETGVLGGFPGHARVGVLSGPGNFPHTRFGEPGFRSSFSHQGFANDGGLCTGDMESIDDSRKRKPPTMGWCRICKVDCETVDGLDLHSQTREHQKMAMDMVVSIKENAKKQKLTSNDRGFTNDPNKSRNVNFDGRGKKH